MLRAWLDSWAGLGARGGHRVKLALTLFLTQYVAEYLAARAIREGKNTPGVIGDILIAESRRSRP